MTVWGWGFLLGFVLILVIWFVFVAPMERQMHDRKMQLMKRRLARNEERLKQQESDKYTAPTHDDDASSDESADPR